MDEYIKREAVIEAIMSEPSDAHYPSWYIDRIKTLSAADVVEVRHGRWIEQEKYTFGVMYDCSICDNRILDNGHSWNYCPNCGAKMAKEVSDDKKQPEEAPGE